MNDSHDLLQRLLEGPPDVELSDDELSLVKVWLRNRESTDIGNMVDYAAEDYGIWRPWEKLELIHDLNDRQRAVADRERQDDSPDLEYVTLDQAAAFVSRAKDTLLNYRGKGLPDPDVQGGGKGKPNEWLWSNIRPWLESTFDRTLPDHPPHRQR